MTSNVKSLVYKMNIVVDCKDAGVLAEFYSKLLGRLSLLHPVW